MTKPLFAALLLAAVTVTGCAKAPLLPKPQAQEPERVVHIAAKPAAHPVPAAELGYADPTRISHDIPTTGVPLGEGTDDGPKTPVNPNASLALMSGPTRQFRAFPIFGGETEVTGVEFSPVGAKATWRLSPHGVPQVSKVKVEILDDKGESAASVDLTPADVGLTARLGADQELTLAPAAAPVLDYLKRTPKAQRLTLHLSLEGPDGKPVPNEAHLPIALDLPMQIL